MGCILNLCWCIILSGLLVELLAQRSWGCLEEEKIGLLKLKDVINYPNGSSLSSWGGQDMDCCRWERVTCDPFTKRVVQLSLNGTRESGLWDFDLFLPFSELQNLSLSENFLEGFKGALRSRKLQVLDLSWNRITQIPSLSGVQSLKFLSLESNRLKNFSYFQELKILQDLEMLNLGYNKMMDEIPPSIGTLNSLKFLSLHNNELNGTLPEGLCKLTNLQELDLGINNLTGVIPSCLSNLASLRLLDLSKNTFTGTIPATLFPSLKLLEYVSLSYNHFEGSLSFSSFGDNSKLEVFELDSRNNNLKVETENAQWTPLFQLKIFRLSNCRLNEPSRAIPSFLLNQYDLRVVNLSHNSMIGDVPTWLLTNNSRLEFLSLGNNFLTGQLKLHPDSYNFGLFWLDVSMNQISGEIAPFIGSILPNLTLLNMSTNAFEGRIPPSLGEMRKLQLLDLSNNYFSGEPPEDLFTGCVSLRFLRLSNNNLRGHLLPRRSNLTFLFSLYLDNNNFSGIMSPGLLNSSNLRLLDINNNSISGNFPDWIGEFPRLWSLVLSKNSLEGSIPTGFCRLKELRFLDLSWNNFDTLPPCANLSSLKYLHLNGNKFRGPLPSALSKSSSLVTLDVRDNEISGPIPDWVSFLSNLRVLLLKGNHLEDSIPLELCKLKNMSVLDLSSNNLSGPIPPCLFNISFGKKRAFDETYEVERYGWTLYRSIRTYSYESHLDVNQYVVAYFFTSDVEEEVEFITKSRSESYKGNILYFISGIDLSWNSLTGPIPPEIGYLNGIHTLNLSHNHLDGAIPKNFSCLKQIQTLDLSYNRLTGEIPSQLTELTFLSVFSVAYNNLSGRTPGRKAQFATFEKSSYEGNSLLCGLPLERSCNTRSLQPATPSSLPEQSDSFKVPFLWSFSGSFVVSFLGIIAFLYLNPMHQGVPFRFVKANTVSPTRLVELSSKMHKTR